jgi:hypothetical protein
VDAVDQDERSGLPVVAVPVENQRMDGFQPDHTD